MSRFPTYLGVFLVAAATLMLEVLLTRITSVSAWYHLAFFVISLGMLGMTAGAVYVFLDAERFSDERVPARLGQSALGFALAIPVCVGVAMAVPLSPVTSLMSFLALLCAGSALAIPFILGGVTLTLALTRAGLPSNLVYGVDLCGAAFGCVLVIPLLDWLDAPSAAIAAGALAALSALCFARARRASLWLPALTVLGLAALALGNARGTPPPLRPAWVKGVFEVPAQFDYLRWNTYSRITVEHTVVGPPAFWAQGRRTPPEAYRVRPQRMLKIDGAAGTVMAELGPSLADHDYLAWDITAFAHHLRPHGAAAVIGVGGGRDVLEAVRVGHRPVVAVELNELIVDLHQHVMRDFSGIASLPGVRLVSDEARSFMARDTEQYQVLTMSLIDTWASTGAGAYSLSENGLYTVEAWRTFLDRLAPGGIFTVSRWYLVDSPGETARMLVLAMETLWQRGVRFPLQHLVLLQNGNVATLLVARDAFSPADIDRVQEAAVRLGFNMMLTPRRFPAHPVLRELARRRTHAELAAWARTQSLDLSAPTDERPFFFNMLKPTTWLADDEGVDHMDLSFLGNLQATQTLVYATLISVLLTLLTVLLPIAARRSALRDVPFGDLASACAYFALIGLGFMFVEMGLLSRLNVYLGHPTLALSVLLGGIIFFTGLGSLASGRVPVESSARARLYPLLPALLIVVSGLSMVPIMQATVSAGSPTRVALSVLLMAPPALGMGLCFPLGLRLVEAYERRLGAQRGARAHAALGPWLWGINGAFGVCASGLALGSSMVWGIGTTLAIGAGCYLVLPLLTRRLAPPR
jgi:spermidine synthase